MRAGKDGVPITDGVFPESKEFLAGYWIVDVDTPERAYAIAAQASAAPGPGGTPLNMPIEVRPDYERAATGDAVTRAAMTKPWDATPSICCANLRRRCSARSHAVFATSPPPRTPCRRRMIAAFTQWPQEGVPENPRGWLIQVASRRMTDQVRSEIARRQRETAVAQDVPRPSAPADEIDV